MENASLHLHDNEAVALATAGKVVDPVCGMSVESQTAKHHEDYAGKSYYFCSAGCKAKFGADPARYIEPSAIEADPAPEGTIYTCPMHPQIRQIGPGSCPICGMALEPEIVTAEAAPNAELADMTRRFWIGLVLSAPVLVLEMSGHVTGLTAWLGEQTSNWLQLILATPVVLWAKVWGPC